MDTRGNINNLHWFNYKRKLALIMALIVFLGSFEWHPEMLMRVLGAVDSKEYSTNGNSGYNNSTSGDSANGNATSGNSTPGDATPGDTDLKPDITIVELKNIVKNDKDGKYYYSQNASVTVSLVGDEEKHKIQYSLDGGNEFFDGEKVDFDINNPYSGIIIFRVVNHDGRDEGVNETFEIYYITEQHPGYNVQKGAEVTDGDNTVIYYRDEIVLDITGIDEKMTDKVIWSESKDFEFFEELCLTSESKYRLTFSGNSAETYIYVKSVDKSGRDSEILEIKACRDDTGPDMNVSIYAIYESGDDIKIWSHNESCQELVYYNPDIYVAVKMDLSEICDDMSGLGRIEYSVNGTLCGNIDLENPYIYIKDGMEIIDITAYDSLGNLDNITVKLISDRVYPAIVSPITVRTNDINQKEINETDGRYISNCESGVVVNFITSEECVNASVRIADTDIITNAHREDLCEWSFIVNDDVNNYVEITLTDKAGNIGTYLFKMLLDREKPDISKDIVPLYSDRYIYYDKSSDVYYFSGMAEIIPSFSDDISSVMNRSFCNYSMAEIKEMGIENINWLDINDTIIVSQSGNITIRAVDEAGNDEFKEIFLVNDDSGPVVNIKYDNKNTSNGKYFKSQKVRIEFKDNNIDSDVRNYISVYSENGNYKFGDISEIRDDEQNPDKVTGYEIIIEFESEDTFEIGIDCKDFVGNEAIVDNAGITEFVVDNEKPEVKLMYSDANSNGYYKDRVAVYITVNDYSPIETVGYKYLSDSDTWTECIYDLENKCWMAYIPYTVLENGTIFEDTIIFEAKDYAGNVGEGRISELKFDNIDPVITINFPHYYSCGTDINDNEKIATEYFNKVINVEIEIADDNLPDNFRLNKNGMTEIIEIDKSGITDGKYKYTVELDAGNYDLFSVTCIDLAGNETISVYDRRIVVDDKIPIVESSISISETGNPVVFLNADERNISLLDMDNDNLFISCKESDNSIKITDISVKDINGNDLYLDGKGLTEFAGNIKNIENGFLWDKSDLFHKHVQLPLGVNGEDGIYTFAVEITDNCGNSSTKNYFQDITADLTAPENITVSYSEDKSHNRYYENGNGILYYDINGVTVFISANDYVSGIDKIVCIYNGVEYEGKVKQDDIDKSLFYTEINIMPEKGTETDGKLHIEVTDGMKNTSVYEPEVTIVLDDKAPELVSSSHENGGSVYSDSGVNFRFSISEGYFYGEDVIITGGNGDVSWEYVNGACTGRYDVTSEGIHNISIRYADRSGNVMEAYSTTIINDFTNPVITLAFDNELLTISIEEVNFSSANVNAMISANDVSGSPVQIQDYASFLKETGNWSHNGNTHAAVLSFPTDANYLFNISCSDLSGRSQLENSEIGFTIDRSAPVNLTVSYSTGILETILENISFGFYNSKATVTITADDFTSGIDAFTYSYVKADGVSTVNAELIEDVADKSAIVYSNGGATASVKFDIPKDMLDAINQFNGTIDFMVTDKSGNMTKYSDSKRIVVDNIAPNSTITYGTPVNELGNNSYYAGPAEIRIVINEANFYAEDVEVEVVRNGNPYNVEVLWSSAGTDEYAGEFSITEDGNYTVTINYSDKSSNRMETISSKNIVVDTTKPMAEITGVEDGAAYTGEVIPQIRFSDENLDEYTYTLTRTYKDKKDVDVTETLIPAARVKVSETDGISFFENIDSIQENDGIYTITLQVSDRAGNVSEAVKKTFSVNRFGSVYEFSDSLMRLINEEYVSSVDEPLVITEYNAVMLSSDSLKIEIVRGTDLIEPVFHSSQKVDETAQIGESGWYQYEYVIEPSNFSSDGPYTLTVASKDTAGNQNSDGQNFKFTIDSIRPEIVSISGMERSSYIEEKHQIFFRIEDIGGISSASLYLNGEDVTGDVEWISGEKDAMMWEGTYTLYQDNTEQKLRIVAYDRAGNVTDTDGEFIHAYEFVPTLMISSNVFVIWYNRKGMFYGSIVGMAAFISLLIFAAGRKRRRAEF